MNRPPIPDIDEPVHLVAYDTTWPAAFAAENRRIVAALAIPAESLEHIGSTAVPGLAAKPIIDMMLGVATLTGASELIRGLQGLGYQDLGEAGVPGRIYLRLRGIEPAFNLHVMERGGEHWVNNLALRSLLRSSPQACARCAADKARAMESGNTRLLGYSAAKAPLLTELLAVARAPKP